MSKFILRKNNIRRGCTKLWWCLALGVLVFAISCKQGNSGGRQEKPNPPPSDEITITVSGDEGVVVKASNAFKFKKKSTWKEIKEKAIDKITSKNNKEIKEWRLKDAQGEILKDVYKFEKDEVVFAVSQRKTASYKVEHWKENIENEEYTRVEKDTEEKAGEAGTNTNAVAKKYEGFSCQGLAQSVIEADGSTVVQIKYKRNRVFLILDLDGGECTTALDDGENGKKLLKGKFEASVVVENPIKQGAKFESWLPELPKTFPKEDSSIVHKAKWSEEIVVNIIGDERVDVCSPVIVPKGSNIKYGDIKARVSSNLKLKVEWQIGDYDVYEWRLESEEGDLLEDSFVITQNVTLYAITNYTKFNIENEILKGYKGELPRGRIIIPDVKKIEDVSFKDCVGLTYVDASRFQNLTSFGEESFDNCSSLKEVKLPSSLNVIGRASFYRCVALTNINFPSSLTTLGISAFSGCSNLESVDISSCTNLLELPYSVFYGCKALRGIKLSNSITSIGGQAFESSGLESIDISQAINFLKIGKDAFKTCKKLKKIDFPSSLTTIEETAFSGCEVLENLTLPKNFVTMGDGSFSACKLLTTVDLFNCENLKIIGYQAFASCEALQDVKFPSGLEKIDSFAFNDSSGLKNLDLSTLTHLKEIGGGAFSGCTEALVKLSSSIEKIGGGAFGLEDGLVSTCCKNITVNDYEVYKKLISANYPETRIIFEGIVKENGLFFADSEKTILIASDGSQEGALTIPSTVVTMRERVFYKNEKITSVDFSSCQNLNMLGSQAFEGCSKLKTIDFSSCSKLTTIDSSCFKDCKLLENINFSACQALVELKQESFYGCAMLQSLDFSTCSNLKSFGSSCFEGCVMLSNLNLSGCTFLKTIDGFAECKALTNVDMSGCSSLEKIGAFTNCIGLIEVKLPSSVKTIAGYAFSGCKALANINISDCVNLEVIEGSAFLDCVALESLNLNSCTHLVRIDTWAFKDAIGIKNVDVSLCNSLSEIGGYAFSGCTVAQIKLPASLTKIKNKAFGDGHKTYCKKVLVPNDNIKKKVRSSGYPAVKIEMY